MNYYIIFLLLLSCIVLINCNDKPKSELIIEPTLKTQTIGSPNPTEDPKNQQFPPTLINTSTKSTDDPPLKLTSTPTSLPTISDTTNKRISTFTSPITPTLTSSTYTPTPTVTPDTTATPRPTMTPTMTPTLTPSTYTPTPTVTPDPTATPRPTMTPTPPAPPSPTPTPIVAQTDAASTTAAAQAKRPTPQPTRTPIPTPARPTPPTCLVWTNENPLSFTSSNNTLGITFNPSNGSNVYKNPDSDNLILLTIKFPYKVSLLKATLINSDQIGIDIKNSFMSSDQIIFSTIQTVEIGKKYNLFISARHPSGNIIGPVNSSFNVMLPATEISIKPGWNLISMPILPQDNELNDVLQNSYVSKIMTTDPNNSQWKNADVLPCTPEKHLQDIKELSNLSTPQGYWFFTSRPETIVIKHNETISYNSINAHLSNLKEGWNLINVISSEKIGTFVKADEYLQTVTWTEGYGYDKTSKLYYSFKPNTNSSLELGYGYYIKIIKNNTD